MHYAFDTHKQFLPDYVGNKVLLCRIYMIGNPEDANFFEKWKNNLGYRFFNTPGQNKIIERMLELIQIQIHHILDEVVYNTLLLSLHLCKRQNFFPHFIGIHFVDVRDFEAILIQQGYIQDGLKLIVVVVPYIGFGTLGPQKSIALLPYTNGVSFNTGEGFQIFNSKRIHNKSSSVRNLFV
jgi:hypothetical protein